MMTKRLRILLLAGVAVLSLAAFYGCGGTDDSTTDSSTGSYSKFGNLQKLYHIFVYNSTMSEIRRGCRLSAPRPVLFCFFVEH